MHHSEQELHKREFFTIKQLSKFSTLGERLIRDALKDRDHPLPHYRLNSQTKIISRADFLSWLEKYRQDPVNRIDQLVHEALEKL
jgi:hypothetical protein